MHVISWYELSINSGRINNNKNYTNEIYLTLLILYQIGIATSTSLNRGFKYSPLLYR